MKNIASILCVCAAAVALPHFALAQTESVEQLKARADRLERQVKEDVEIISALRSENIELKRQIRAYKRAAVQAMPAKSAPAAVPSAKTEVKKAEVKATPAAAPAPVPAAAPAAEPEKPAEKTSGGSVWDNMFPF